MLTFTCVNRSRTYIYMYIYVWLCQAPTASLSACVSHILEYALTTARPRAGVTRRNGARGKRTARLAHATWASWCSDASVYIIFFIFFEKKMYIPAFLAHVEGVVVLIRKFVVSHFFFLQLIFLKKKGKPKTCTRCSFCLSFFQFFCAGFLGWHMKHVCSVFYSVSPLFRWRCVPPVARQVLHR